MRNYKEHLKNINTFIFDYDGVLTEGIVILLSEGEPLRTAHVKDGYALQLAVKKGYNIAVISGGRSETIVNRLKSLNIQDIHIGVESKIEVFNKYLKSKGVNPSQVLFMGDDIPDYEALQKAGIATCPSDASQEIKEICDYISPHKGGRGCVRDVIEQVLKVQGNWMNHDAYAW